MNGRASFVVVLVLALSGCAGSQTGNQLVLTAPNTELTPVVAELAPLTGTNWTVDTLIDGQTATRAGATESLMFGADTVTISGCLTGTAQYQVTGSTIRFSKSSTVIAPCTEQGAKVVSALLDVMGGDVTYKIDARVLTLTTAGGQGLGLRA